MRKNVLLLFSLVSLFSIVFVSALLYNGVISEEKLMGLNEDGITITVNPVWSAEFQTPEGEIIVISFLSINEIKKADLSTVWSGNWFYLQDGSDEYLADSSVVYVDMDASTGICSATVPKEDCGISKILLEFKPESEFQGLNFAYNGFISDEYTRDLVALSNPQFELDFSPQTGKLSLAKYNSEVIELTDEEGIMSYGGFSKLYE